MTGPQNERAHVRSHLPFFGPLPHLSPDRRGAGSSKSMFLLSDDAKASFERAESNLNALNTVDLGPKRPFSVGECALWARLAGPQFAATSQRRSAWSRVPKTTARLLRWPRRSWPSNIATRRAFRSKSSSRRPSPAN